MSLYPPNMDFDAITETEVTPEQAKAYDRVMAARQRLSNTRNAIWHNEPAPRPSDHEMAIIMEQYEEYLHAKLKADLDLLQDAGYDVALTGAV